MAGPTITIIHRDRADGSVRWFLWIRRPRPERDKLIPVEGYTHLSDRPAVEAFAKPYREALRKGLTEPKPESATEWFQRYVKLHGSLGNETRGMLGDWERYVAPHLGATPMMEVSRSQCKALRDALAAARLREDGPSAKRIMNVWSRCVRAPFARAWTDDDPRYGAVHVGPVDKNPTIGLNPPVSADDIEKDERERQALEPDEFLALISCADVPLADRRVYAIAAFTGLRPEELFYLRWRDVRLEGQKPRIHVHGAYDIRTGREKSTKTGEERDVPIHPHLRALLTFMRDAADDPDARVVPLVSRKRHGERYADMVRQQLRKAGVTRPELLHGTAKRMPFDLRSFRTTFATWAVSAGYERALVGTWLGHKPSDTTSLHYVKDVPGFEDVLIRAWRAGAVPPFPELPADVNGHVKCERRPLFSRAKQRRGRDSKPRRRGRWRAVGYGFAGFFAPSDGGRYGLAR